MQLKKINTKMQRLEELAKIKADAEYEMKMIVKELKPMMRTVRDKTTGKKVFYYDKAGYVLSIIHRCFTQEYMRIRTK